MSATHRVFVYGSLERGFANHGRLAEGTFLAEAVTESEFALYALGGFPGMVRAAEGGCAVRGELWEVDDAVLADLDELEGNGSLFLREEIPVLTDDGRRQTAWAYLYLRDVTGCRRLGAVWEEK